MRCGLLPIAWAGAVNRSRTPRSAARYVSEGYPRCRRVLPSVDGRPVSVLTAARPLHALKVSCLQGGLVGVGGDLFLANRDALRGHREISSQGCASDNLTGCVRIQWHALVARWRG